MSIWRRAAAKIGSLPIGLKAFAGSAVLISSLLAIGAIAAQSLDRIMEQLETTVNAEVERAASKERMIDALGEAHLDLFRYVAWAGAGLEDEALREIRSDIARNEAAVESQLALLAERDDLTAFERGEVQAFSRSWKRYRATAAREVGFADTAAATRLMGAVDREFEDAALHLRRLTAAARSQTRMAVRELRADAADAARRIRFAGFAVVLLASAILFFFSRSIVAPVRDVTRAMRQVSIGNFDFHPESAYRHRRDEIGQLVAAIGTFCEDMRRARDEIVRNERELRAQNLRLDTALGHMSQGLCMFDGDSRLVMSNARYACMYGLDPQMMKPGTPFAQILRWRIEAGGYAGDDPDAYIRERLAAVGDRQPSVKILQQLDGRTIAVSHRPTEGGGWVATHDDITEIRRIEAQIAHMAHHDGLTGLPNRLFFRQQLEAACAGNRDGEMVAVLCLDLDRFKSVNDSFGHPVGDLLLQAVAGRLRGCPRDRDVVARLSGDEFALILPAIPGREVAGAVAERIVAALSEPFDLNGQRVCVGTSIGIAIGSDGASPEELVRSADTALYRAKADGRGAFRFFEPGMDEAMNRRNQLETDLRTAMHDEQLELHFQPIIDVSSDAVVAFEALLRWTHPVHGAIPPAEFIPVAEEIGVIETLGAWVIREACRAAAGWPEHIRIAVNLSPLQFANENLVAVVTDALARAGLVPGRLELEITESVLLQDTAANMRILHRLRGLGVRIAMDDFGTGYSSLSYLRSFPFDKIKIDRSFIMEIPGDPGSGAIVKAVSDLAESLGMSTTAEGVETVAQLDYLRTQGCTEVQGFHFSPAQPADEVPALLARLTEEAADRRFAAAFEDAPAARDHVRLVGGAGG